MVFYETSAKTNVNIEVAFREMVEKVTRRQEEMGKILGDIEVGRRDIRIVANNMSRRMNRSTRAKLQYNAGEN